MFTHHDLVILIIAMMTTITCAMEIDSQDMPMTTSSYLAQIMNRMSIEEDNMDTQDDSNMEVEENDDMEIDEIKRHPLNTLYFL